MNKEFTIADCIEIDKRKSEAERFYNAVFEPDEMPLIVTDMACLDDLYLGDEFEMISKIKEKYGVTITTKHFEIPLWKLIDILEKKELR